MVIVDGLLLFINNDYCFFVGNLIQSCFVSMQSESKDCNLKATARSRGEDGSGSKRKYHSAKGLEKGRALRPVGGLLVPIWTHRTMMVSLQR